MGVQCAARRVHHLLLTPLCARADVGLGDGRELAWLTGRQRYGLGLSTYPRVHAHVLVVWRLLVRTPPSYRHDARGHKVESV